jgi:hypothetical protein
LAENVPAISQCFDEKGKIKNGRTTERDISDEDGDGDGVR